jgi:hypothetical protein
VARDVEATAKATGLSISEEIERRLTRFAEWDKMLGGPKQTMRAVAMALAFERAGSSIAEANNIKGDWSQNAECYLAGVIGVLGSLLIGRPRDRLTDEQVVLFVDGQLKSQLLNSDFEWLENIETRRNQSRGKNVDQKA